MIENKIYRVLNVGGTWVCAEVDSDTSAMDFEWCYQNRKPLNFTIRRFANNAMFLLYSPHMTPTQINRQADYMSSTPGR